jgi:hypothetical protein
VGRRGGVLTGGSAVARRRQGVAGDLEGVTRKVPGKEESTGAHRNGGVDGEVVQTASGGGVRRRGGGSGGRRRG